MKRIFSREKLTSSILSHIKAVVSRATVFTLLIGMGIPIMAQTEPAPVFERTSSQKGVEISTDVLAVALPATALTLTLCHKDWKGLIQGVESAAVTAGVTLILKYSVKEWRPDHSNQHSFPSGHSAVTFASAAYLQRRYGWAWGAPAYALATYVAWGRCFAKKHYWYDVVAGAAIGAGSSYIFTRPFARKHDLKISPVTDGTYIGIYASFNL